MSSNVEKKSWKKICCTLLVIVLLLSGCGIIGGSGQAENSDAPKIGMITGQGGIEDPVYRKAWDGLQEAKQDAGVEIGYVKAKNDKEYPSKLAQLKNDKYQVIFTVGQSAVTAVLEAAKQNPKIKYICLDSRIEGTIPANVLGVTYKVEEAAYLAGYLAGRMTKSNVTGFISGDNKEGSLRYYYGFKTGLRKANSYCELMKGIAGTFTDKDRVREMTERMAEAGADVVFHVAGTAGEGMIKVMEENDTYAIGAYVDQSKIAPESVLTSVIIHHDQVITELVEKYQKKSLVLGKNEVYGLAEKAVGLAETTEGMVPENIYTRILEQQDKIIDGQMTIPATELEYLNF